MSTASPAFRPPALPRRAPRWSVVGIGDPDDLVGPGVDGGAAGDQGDGLGRAAVVRQGRGQAGIGDADQVAVEPFRPPEPPVPTRLFKPATVPAMSSAGLPVVSRFRDDGVIQADRAAGDVEAGAAAAGRRRVL